MRPVFGDKETLKQIDPYHKILQQGIVVPTDILVCPFCENPIAVTFDDIWVKDDSFGAGKIEVCCVQDGEWIPFWLMDEHYRHDYIIDGYQRDIQKVVRWIQGQYPTFKN